MRTSISIAMVVLACGCGGDDDDAPPVDVEGMYTVATTNGPNDCALMSWTPGESSMGIPVTITQSGADFTADVGGAARVGLDLSIGAHVFSGRVSGNRLTATLVGTRPYSAGACTSTLNAELEATLTGDVLEGVIHYDPQTNGAADCGVLNSCENDQDFNGTRPPT
jgi:hypothetical protein